MSSVGRPLGPYGTYRPQATVRPNRVIGSLDGHLGAVAQRIVHLIGDRSRRHRRIRQDRKTPNDGKTLIFVNGRMLCECALNEPCAWRVEHNPTLQIVGVYSDGIDWADLLDDLRMMRDVTAI